MASNITLKISSDVSQAVKGIDSVNKSLQQMQKSTETASSKFAKFTTAFIGAKGVFEGSVQIIGKVINYYLPIPLRKKLRYVCNPLLMQLRKPVE